jgi:glycosyltransferase involved in cell wall biosynthesis
VTSPPEAALRVALYAPAWPRGALPNGIVTYTSHIVPALRSLGVETWVLASLLAPENTDARVRPVSLGRDSIPARLVARVRDRLALGATAERRNALAIAREVQRLERERGIALVEMEESFGWCGRVAERCRIPVVARLHGPWFLNGAMVETSASAAYRRRVEREGWALARVSGVTAPSRDVLERTRAHYGMPLEGAEVIPHPIPLAPAAARWEPAGSEPASALFVGRFDNHKGGDILVEAFARVRSAEPAARLVFVGPDPGATDASGRRWTLADFVRSRLPREADHSAVEWLGPQPPEAIAQMRLRASLVVACSRYETFGYTLGEAMAQGCPIVATAAGGMAELVEDGQSALVVPPGDAEALAVAILRLLRDRALAARLGRRAADECARRYAPEAIARRTLAFYRKVLRGGPERDAGG